jgi:endoribonuclease Dicer
MKQIACLEACKKLHEIGALTDNLVPDIVVEEGTVQECGNFFVWEPFIPSCFDCFF